MRFIWLIVLSMPAWGLQPAAYTFTDIDVPGAQATYPSGINSAGQICGYYQTIVTGPSHAFVRSVDGVITTFDAPGSMMTAALGINNAGLVVGYWSPDLTGNVEHMFVRDLTGAITTFDVPNVPINQASGINDFGEMVVNSLTEPGPAYPLFRSAAGTYTGVTVAGFSTVYVNGLNNNGLAVGQAYGTGGIAQGFVVAVNGMSAAVVFTVPESTTATVANGINDSNTVVGSYDLGYRGGESSHAYIRDSAGNYQGLDVPGSIATLANGINDLDEIVGEYDEASGARHGFLARPAQHRPRPAPASR